MPWSEAFEWVDAAMYHSKEHGRNRATGIVRVDERLLSQTGLLARTLEACARDGSVTLDVTTGPPLPSREPDVHVAVADPGRMPERAP